MSKVDFKFFFPHFEMRDCQKECFKFLEENFEDKKFAILELPTGCGKSAIAYAYSKWVSHNYQDNAIQNGSYILTTQKILQEQYINDHPDLLNISAKSNYKCAHRSNMTCEEGKVLCKISSDSKSKKCNAMSCTYSKALFDFISSAFGVTNVSYFLNQSIFSEDGNNEKVPLFQKRKLLVIDECHNLEQIIIDHVSVRISDFDCSKIEIEFPKTKNDLNTANDWIRNVLSPTLDKKIEFVLDHIASLKLTKNKEIKLWMSDLSHLVKIKQKLSVFIEKYDEKYWILTSGEDFFEIKPLYASFFAKDVLFNYGEKVLLMSGTILNKQIFCQNLGITEKESCFLTMDSPYPKENRPVNVLPVGRMGYNYIKNTLPDLSSMVQEILKQHSGSKGIIHAHTYNIALFLKNEDKTGRLLIHDSSNRIDIFKDHISSTEDSVIISPSMTEGVNLIEDFSRFQIICKVPYPFLGDNYVQEKMKRCKGWYELQTAKTIMQCIGRSVRSEKDHAVSYILDEDFVRFHRFNKALFPCWFNDSIVY